MDLTDISSAVPKGDFSKISFYFNVLMFYLGKYQVLALGNMINK